MARYYDDTSVQPPEPQRRYWTRAEEDALLRRVGYADVALIGRLRLVNHNQRFNTPLRVALGMVPEERLFGELDELLDGEGTLWLQLKEGQLDFRLALKVAGYLPGRRYLLLLKRKPDPYRGGAQDSGWQASLWRPVKPAPPFHWILYRADAPLLEEVRAMYRSLKQR